MTRRIDVSVVMLFERAGGTGERALQALLDQETELSFEILLVGSSVPAFDDRRIVTVVEADRNPALRRNRAVAAARGEYVAFIDDDAFAASDWIDTAVRWLRAHHDVVAVGGPDPAPPDSPLAERISDLLLSTRFIGSGIAAHEVRREHFDVQRASDIALVNLFGRSEALRAAGGFDESIGYIGEDTAMLEQLMKLGRVTYHPRLVVRHRRRPFPGPFLRQRWRYRVKTGQMIVSRGSSYLRDARVWILLLTPLLFILMLLFAPLPLLVGLALYAAATFILAAPRLATLPVWSWPLTPLLFALHHATYALGIWWGIARSTWRQKFGLRGRSL